MRVRLTSLAVLACLCASPGQVLAFCETRVFGYVHLGEQFQTPLIPESQRPQHWEALVQDLFYGTYNTPPSYVKFVLDNGFGSAPGMNDCSCEALVDGFSAARLRILDSHGYEYRAGSSDYPGGIELERYTGEPGQDPPHLEARVRVIGDRYHLDYTSPYPIGDIYWKQEQSPGWPLESLIFVTDSGLRKLVSLMDTGVQSPLLLNMCCDSETHAAAWGVDPALTRMEGPSMLAYRTGLLLQAPVVTVDFHNAMHTFACTYEMMGINNSFEYLIPHPDIGVLQGWRDNQVCPMWWCVNTAGRWYHTSAFAGAVRMAYIGERAESTFRVLADGEVVAEFPGRDTDAYGRLRCYVVPVPLTASDFVCIESDHRGLETASEDFGWQTASGVWEDILQFDDLSMEIVHAHDWPVWEADPWQVEDPRWEWLAARDAWLADADTVNVDHGDWGVVFGDSMAATRNCAHIMVYADQAMFGAATDVMAQIGMDFPERSWLLYWNAPGDPMWAKQYLLEVAEANAAYNQQTGTSYCPVDPGPTLIVVGSDHYVDALHFSDPPTQACQQATCASYNLIADIYNEDGLPDCPVLVIPAHTPQEASTMCIYAHEWNEGTAVNQNGRGVFLLYDMWQPSQGQNTMMDGPMLRVRNMYQWAGSQLEAGALIRRSEYIGDLYPAYQAIVQEFGSGVRDLWAMGLQMGPFSLPCLGRTLWEGYGLELERNQVFVVFAPGCETAAVSMEVGPHVSMARRLMLQGPTVSRAAGFLGQLNGDWSGAHGLFADVFRNELGNGVPGCTFDLIVHNAVRTVQEQVPHYGLGVVWLGSLTRMHGAFAPSTSADGARDVGTNRGGLWAHRNRASTDIHLDLATEAHVAVDVYDASGRFVSAIKHGDLAAGEYTYTWFERTRDGAPVSAGVYFIRAMERFTTGEMREETTRVLVVQ